LIVSRKLQKNEQKMTKMKEEKEEGKRKSGVFLP